MMTEATTPGTRGQEHMIEIDAPPEAVWRAITEAEEITRWYVPEAEVDLREGGRYRVSWGEGMEGTSEIAVLEPRRRLRLEHLPMEGSPDIPTGPIVEEYHIESRGGRTVLRLVTSGIPASEDWDWFYEGTKRGWTIFLMGLRHYLERHGGTPRDQIQIMQGLSGTFEAAWSALVGRQGLGFSDPMDAASTGDRYRGRTAFGQDIDGEVLLVDPPYRLLVTVDGLDDALLGVAFEQMGPSSMLYLSLSTFGLAATDVEALRERWTGWASELFPDAGGLVEGFEEVRSGLEEDGAGA